MPNALPAGNGSKTFTGTRAHVVFNGNVVGYISNLSGNESYTLDPVEVCDSLPAKEHAIIGYRVSLQAGIFRTVAPDGVSTEDSPGSLKAQQIFPRLDQALKLEGVELLIVDSVTGQVLYVAEGVKVADNNFSIPARGLVTQNLSMVALRLRDESEL